MNELLSNGRFVGTFITGLAILLFGGILYRPLLGVFVIVVLASLLIGVLLNSGKQNNQNHPRPNRPSPSGGGGNAGGGAGGTSRSLSSSRPAASGSGASSQNQTTLIVIAIVIGFVLIAVTR